MELNRRICPCGSLESRTATCPVWKATSTRFHGCSSGFFAIPHETSGWLPRPGSLSGGIRYGWKQRRRRDFAGRRLHADRGIVKSWGSSVLRDHAAAFCTLSGPLTITALSKRLRRPTRATRGGPLTSQPSRPTLTCPACGRARGAGSARHGRPAWLGCGPAHREPAPASPKLRVRRVGRSSTGCGPPSGLGPSSGRPRAGSTTTGTGNRPHPPVRERPT
jgi:hypothetical protein